MFQRNFVFEKSIGCRPCATAPAARITQASWPVWSNINCSANNAWPAPRVLQLCSNKRVVRIGQGLDQREGTDSIATKTIRAAKAGSTQLVPNQRVNTNTRRNNKMQKGPRTNGMDTGEWECAFGTTNRPPSISGRANPNNCPCPPTPHRRSGDST